MDAAVTGRDRRRTNVDRQERSPATGTASEAQPDADARLVEQLRAGDADAGHRFVRDYYPGVYRYLLYLTGRRELAEDLTQETFLQAWRHLDQFAARAPLRVWLHRIAHREFLQALRQARSPSQRPGADARSLEELGEAAAPAAADWREAVELRELLRKLPLEEREVLVLHYLHGYTSAEIGQIVRAPAGTVRYRLAMARAKLQRELGEGDLAYLNELSVPGTRAAGGRQWAWLPLDQMSALETRLGGGGVGRWALGIRHSVPTPNAQRPTPGAKRPRRSPWNDASFCARRRPALPG
jgi:RNA polymerase sigma-70 factor, ECF subfamily